MEVEDDEDVVDVEDIEDIEDDDDDLQPNSQLDLDDLGEATPEH